MPNISVGPFLVKLLNCGERSEFLQVRHANCVTSLAIRTRAEAAILARIYDSYAKTGLLPQDMLQQDETPTSIPHQEVVT